MELGLILLSGAVVIAAVLLAWVLSRPKQETRPDTRLDALIVAQGEIKGQFQNTVAAQAELQRTLSERLDALNNRMGESLSESATKTSATLAGIGERLNVIDAAQKNISALSSHVVALSDILSDKQRRAAPSARSGWRRSFADQLTRRRSTKFQHTLSNGSRPDCIIRLPNVKAVVVVDSAKFPARSLPRR